MEEKGYNSKDFAVIKVSSPDLLIANSAMNWMRVSSITILLDMVDITQ